MSLSRKHFTALAAIVADIDEGGGTVFSVELADRLADWAASENPNFDRDRFLRAALPTIYDDDRDTRDWDAYNVNDDPHHNRGVESDQRGE